MNNEEIIKKLREPFSAAEIDWKIQVTTQDKARGMAVAYIDSRAIQKRLDEALGPFGWSNDYQPWQDKAQICKLSIYCTERGEWVTKCDGAENTDYEPVKGGLSDAFKRTASLWGIGRYLYDIEGVWVEVEAKGKSFAIKETQFGKLEAAYNQAVAKIFGASSVKGSSQNQPGVEAPQQPKPSAPPPAPPTRQSTQQPSQQPNPGTEYDYTVQSAKPAGKSSLLLELAASDGKQIKAYVVKNDNNAANMIEGARLRNVSLIQKNGNYGPYNQIDAYEMAA